MDEAVTWLREQGLASTAKRADREASEGPSPSGHADGAVSIVELRSETDFVAKSDRVRRLRRASSPTWWPPRVSTPSPSGPTSSTP